MPKKCEIWGLLCATALIMPTAAYAEDALADALTGGKISGNFRLRYESVDIKDTPTLKDASALTLRSRLGYETAPLYGVTGILEFENTMVVDGKDRYAPETPGYVPIVDPAHTEVNRAYLRYRGVSKLDIGLGRQRINLDNQRFVGSVAWRQDEQTFDAFTANYQGVPDWSFYYAYINRVNGIASEVPTYNYDINSSDNLFNIAYTGFVIGKITAYGYFLNNQDSDYLILNTGNNNGLNPTLRYNTINTEGLRFDGGYAVPSTLPIRLLYTAEYAMQSFKKADATGTKYDTTYSLLEAGAAYTTKYGTLSAKLARETLGSDDGLQGFQTPYATKHPFNGWVDMFLNTPPQGLVDTYATLGGDLTPYGVKTAIVYHRFSMDDGGVGKSNQDFGNEWNLQALKQFGPNYTLGVKYGIYKADKDVAKIGANSNIDTKKFWLWGEFTF